MTFEEAKIKALLKLYGADENEIENFINDLKNPQEAPSDEFDATNEDDFKLEAK